MLPVPLIRFQEVGGVLEASGKLNDFGVAEQRDLVAVEIKSESRGVAGRFLGELNTHAFENYTHPGGRDVSGSVGLGCWLSVARKCCQEQHCGREV